MNPILKHLKPAEALSLTNEVEWQPGQIVSKTLAQNPGLTVTLFAFDKGEEISAHKSTGDALVTALDGTAEVTIDEQIYTVSAGQSILMPAGHPHAVRAVERFKMFLLVVFPEKKAD